MPREKKPYVLMKLGANAKRVSGMDYQLWKPTSGFWGYKAVCGFKGSAEEGVKHFEKKLERKVIVI